MKKKTKELNQSHNAWIKSLGVNIDVKTGKVKKKEFTGYDMPNYNADINGVERVSIPLGNRIPVGCTKVKMPKVQLPEGKTIGIAYNKGNYQIVDSADFKTVTNFINNSYSFFN